MANIYYKIDGDYCYYTNEEKDGYSLLPTITKASDTVSRRKIVIIELYNDKFELPQKSSYLFYLCSNTTFNDTDKGDTSNVTDMSRMFYNVSELGASLDVSTGDTSNVTNMSYMFANVRIDTLDLSSGDVSNVQNFSSMFENNLNICPKHVNLCGGDLSSATTIKNMFSGCNLIEEIIVDDNTDGETMYPNITSYDNFLLGCNKLPNMGTYCQDIQRANNINGFGAFGRMPRGEEYEAYIKTSEGGISVEVYA